MHILAAFDKFKNSLSAAEACAAAAAGVRDVFGPDATITQASLTDGGEGFCPILTEAADGYMEHHTICGPLGHDVEAPLGWVALEKLPEPVRAKFRHTEGKLAVIEMAAAAGLEDIPEAARHPKHCTTRGVGELIRIATAEGADAILLGIGGSATSDLGLGALEALGLEFPGIQHITPEQWGSAQRIVGELIDVPPIFIACDVDNPLLGPQGAAAVYGPQKGLKKEEVASYDQETARMAALLCEYAGVDTNIRDLPGTGAAGGIGFGLKVAFAADFLSGFELVSQWLDLEAKVRAADCVLSGEGKIDKSSLSGKGPHALAAAANRAGKPTILLAGAIEDAIAAVIRDQFPRCRVYSITPKNCPLPEALANGAKHLRQKTVSALQSE